MRHWRGPLLVIAIVAALAAVELASGSGGGSRREAPTLPSAVLIGPRVTLSSLRGRPAAINFWASWCQPCRHEAPQLERFARSLHGQARLVGVDWSDGLSGARSFLHRYGWTFPVLRDAEGTVGARYGLIGLPTTFVLNSRGQIVRTLSGPQTESRLRAALAGVS